MEAYLASERQYRVRVLSSGKVVIVPVNSVVALDEGQADSSCAQGTGLLRQFWSAVQGAVGRVMGHQHGDDRCGASAAAGDATSKVFRILKLGQTGSGKTSLLNLLYNIQIILEYGFEGSVDKFREFQDIELENAPGAGRVRARQAQPRSTTSNSGTWKSS